MDKKDLPLCNAFIVTTEDGNLVIPSMIINGKEVRLENLDPKHIPRFKALAADMSAHTGRTIHYVEYAEPTLIEEITPVKDENSIHITGTIEGGAIEGLGEMFQEMAELIQERLKADHAKKDSEDDENRVH